MKESMRDLYTIIQPEGCSVLLCSLQVSFVSMVSIVIFMILMYNVPYLNKSVAKESQCLVLK